MAIKHLFYCFEIWSLKNNIHFISAELLIYNDLPWFVSSVILPALEKKTYISYGLRLFLVFVYLFWFNTDNPISLSRKSSPNYYSIYDIFLKWPCSNKFNVKGQHIIYYLNIYPRVTIWKTYRNRKIMTNTKTYEWSDNSLKNSYLTINNWEIPPPPNPGVNIRCSACDNHVLLMISTHWS